MQLDLTGLWDVASEHHSSIPSLYPDPLQTVGAQKVNI